MKKLFPCVKILNTANCVTLTGCICGLLSVIFCFSGSRRLVYPFIMLAALLDIVDGLVARKLNQCSVVGEVFDSLADMSSFVVAPALIFCYYGAFEPLWCIAAVLYALCGTLRLAYFSVEEQHNVFIGLASPWASSIVVGLCVLFFDLFKFSTTGSFAIIMPLICAAVAIGMVLGCIRPKKFSIFIAAVLAFGLVVAVWSLIAI